jgi:hypothetical protein
VCKTRETAFIRRLVLLDRDVPNAEQNGRCATTTSFAENGGRFCAKQVFGCIYGFVSATAKLPVTRSKCGCGLL